MTSGNSIVRKLRDQAMDENVSVASLLRTAKVIATKLELDDALSWISRELEGYPYEDPTALPECRRLRSILEMRNPFHGWQPIFIASAQTAEAISQAPARQSVGSLEKLLAETDKGDPLNYDLGPTTENSIRKSIKFNLPIRARVNRSCIFKILESVRNLILDWALELEKASILGEDISFTEHDKKVAKPITNQTIIAHNVSLVGDGSTVNNTQTAAGDLNVEGVRAFAAQARESLDALPPETVAAILPNLDKLDGELASASPNEGKLRSILESIRSVAENAAGSLLATGIGAAAATLLG